MLQLASMNVRDDRREEAIERMADHVLAEGLAAATLRPLAAAVGTSDRMLLYYFADKEELLTATLERIAKRIIAQLDSAIPVEPRQPFPVLLEQVWAAVTSERLQAFMPLRLDLASVRLADFSRSAMSPAISPTGSWPG